MGGFICISYINHCPSWRVEYDVSDDDMERRRCPYSFVGYGGGPNECYHVSDAIVLTPDGSLSGSGSHFKPMEGSVCVALAGPGGSVWIVGFYLPPRFDESGQTAPVIGDASDEAGPLNNVAGDKVLRSDGDAALMLKRGGSVVVQGGPG